MKKKEVEEEELVELEVEKELYLDAPGKVLHGIQFQVVRGGRIVQPVELGETRNRVAVERGVARLGLRSGGARWRGEDGGRDSESTSTRYQSWFLDLSPGAIYGFAVLNIL